MASAAQLLGLGEVGVDARVELRLQGSAQGLGDPRPADGRLTRTSLPLR